MADIPRDERQVTDADFFNAMDLSRRGLAKVRRAVEVGDLPAARQATVVYFRTRRRPRWFFDLRDERRGKVPSSWDGYDPRAIVRAEAALENRFHLSGPLVWDFGENLKWRTAEMRGLGAPPSVFKRCLYMRDLAVASAQTRRPAFAAKFAELVGRWLTDWPLTVDRSFGPTKAIMSQSDGHKAMPTAFRVVTWLDCLYGGIVFAPGVPIDTAFGLIRSMWFTAVQYRRFEKCPYMPANHHLWERGTAPFIFGLMFPEFPELAKLTDQGRRVIRRHVRSSFLSDGGYEERSASYTFGPMRMFMMPMELASLNRARLFAAPERRLIKRCVETMAQTAMPHGAPPDVGDGSASVEKVGKLLGQSARMLGSDLSADVIRRLKLRRYVRPEDVDALKAVARRELPLTVHLPASGYFVARDGWTPNASAMSLSVPARGLPNHAHDDALSLQLVVRGVPVVGTPMTTMYNIVQQDRYRNNVIPLRGHFHAMTSHNLVLVNGEPLHSIEELARNWSVEPTPVKTSWEGSGGGVRVVSIHRSYPGVRLEREVTFRYRTGWVVWDRVRGAAGRPHIARWHFEYGVDVVEEGDAYMAVRGRGGLRIRLARSLSGYLPPS